MNSEKILKIKSAQCFRQKNLLKIHLKMKHFERLLKIHWTKKWKSEDPSFSAHIILLLLICCKAYCTQWKSEKVNEKVKKWSLFRSCLILCPHVEIWGSLRLWVRKAISYQSNKAHSVINASLFILQMVRIEFDSLFRALSLHWFLSYWLIWRFKPFTPFPFTIITPII